METRLVLTAIALLVLAILIYASSRYVESPEVQVLRAIHNMHAGDVDGEQGRAVSNITGIIFLVIAVATIAAGYIW